MYTKKTTHNKMNTKSTTKEFIIIEDEKDVPKPIIKWVGGKTQILHKLIPEFPKSMNNYYEIFMGGGSVLLALLTSIQNGTILLTGGVYAYDVNEALIHVYKNIQSNHYELLFDETQKIIKEFNESGEDEKNVELKTFKPTSIVEAKHSKHNYYYWIRDKYNSLSAMEKNSVTGSALFIFLNKTCFRGVFREGPNGFNVPYGNYTNPEIINKEHMEVIHHLIQGVVFEVKDFEDSLNEISGPDDYAYLDPPYAPETKTSFVKYTKLGFTIDKHKRLFEICQKLTTEKKRFMMSNADVTLVKEHFAQHYNVASVMCKRAINSKNPESKVSEVIIKNY
jgi:DNA adenine methylase